MKIKIYEMQLGLCFYCDKEIELRNTVLDHLLPQARGGKDGSINRVASCRDCDAHKGSRMPTAAEIALQAMIRGCEVSIKTLTRSCRDWSHVQPAQPATTYTWHTVQDSPLGRALGLKRI